MACCERCSAKHKKIHISIFLTLFFSFNPLKAQSPISTCSPNLSKFGNFEVMGMFGKKVGRNFFAPPNPLISYRISTQTPLKSYDFQTQ